MPEKLTQSDLVRTFERRKGQSEEFHQRELHDPLDFAFPMPGGLAKLISEDEKGIEAAADRRDFRELAEFTSDRAMLGFMEGTDDVEEYAALAQDTILQNLKDQHISSADRISLYSRLIDMEMLRAFNKHRLTSATLDKKQRRDAEIALEGVVKRGILEGATALEDMQRTFAELKHGHKEWQLEARKELVGKMFELLYLTNERRKLYADESYDQRMVFGTSVFQDSAAMLYDPNHNFDVIQLSSEGEVTRIIQCKTNGGGPKYAEIIEPAAGHDMDRFFDNPAPFVRAIKLAVQNPNDPRMEKSMKEAVVLIDSLFQKDSRNVGAAATRELVRV